jgi:hypothetical protein
MGPFRPTQRYGGWASRCPSVPVGSGRGRGRSCGRSAAPAVGGLARHPDDRLLRYCIPQVIAVSSTYRLQRRGSLTASVGRPRCPSRLRRTGPECVWGLLPRRERLEDKVGAARPLIVEERRALQVIAFGNRVVLEDVAPATQPPTMLRVTCRHKPRACQHGVSRCEHRT